jgi:6-phosphogluconolactonase
MLMKFEICPNAETVARRAAEIIAAEARAATAARGRFVMAVSGGRTPWLMLRALASEAVPWTSVQVFQVDERIAPAGHPDRNLVHIRESLMEHVPLNPGQLHPMPVEEPNLKAAAARYALALQEIAASPPKKGAGLTCTNGQEGASHQQSQTSIAAAPPILDLIHLGLGPDGHTASLVPGDPVLEINDTDVALTGVYQGRRRMTLTYPIINRSRCVLWVVTGSEKEAMLARLRAADPSIPAGRVRQDQAFLVADRAAAGQQESTQPT